MIVIALRGADAAMVQGLAVLHQDYSVTMPFWARSVARC
jgi:hypothetical protein